MKEMRSLSILAVDTDFLLEYARNIEIAYLVDASQSISRELGRLGQPPHYSRTG